MSAQPRPSPTDLHEQGAPATPQNALGDAFLAHLRTCSGMAGAALAASGQRWIAADGAVPPSDLPRHLFGATGITTSLDHPSCRFLVVVPVPSVELDHPLWLVLWDFAQRSELAAARLLARMTELVSHAAMNRRRALELQRLQLLERASQTARIGMWSCTLPDEKLVWTDGVYDLFGLPHGSRLDRNDIVRMYTAESAERLAVLRSRAIATLGDFHLDAEIITAHGKQRWIRITAAVDGVAGQPRLLLGMKRDITEEKLLTERTRRLAETDALTGLANRAIFQARLDDLHGQKGGVPVGALLLVDLDHFKSINDELGHVQGDYCLSEAGRRLSHCCPPGAQVARIGGDEFAILTDGRVSIDLDHLGEAIVTAFAYPFNFGGHRRIVGVSVGAAHRDQHDADALYRNADTALYRAKSAGRGTWRRYTSA